MYKKLLLVILALCLCLDFPQSIAYAESKLLHIYGKEASGDFENDYLRQSNVDFRWYGVDVANDNSAQSMAFQIQTNNDCFDLYEVGYAYCGLETLQSKGFCYNMSVYQSLIDIVDDMYPYLSEAVHKDGELFAMPISVSTSGWAYSKQVLESVGLDTQNLPTTYEDFLCLIDWWIKEGYAQNEDYSLFLGVESSRSYLINTVINSYINYCTTYGVPIDMTDPVIYSILSKIDEIDTDELDRQINEASLYQSASSKALFLLNYNYSDLSSDRNAVIVPIHFGMAEEDIFYLVDINCFAINPNSDNIDMASEYIRTFYMNMDAEERISLFSDSSIVSVENPNYRNEIQENEQQRESVTMQYASDSVLLEDALHELDEGKKLIEENRWLITEEEVLSYRHFTERLKVRKQNILERNSSSGTLEIVGLISQYSSRTITLEQFAQKSNQVISMILGEGN
ncbi:MAG: hypothetical protein RR301_08380 [Clostridia bacterium]